MSDQRFTSDVVVKVANSQHEGKGIVLMLVETYLGDLGIMLDPARAAEIGLTLIEKAKVARAYGIVIADRLPRNGDGP